MKLLAADRWAIVCQIGQEFPDEFNVLEMFQLRRDAEERAAALNESPQWKEGQVNVVPVSAKFKLLSKPTEMMEWMSGI